MSSCVFTDALNIYGNGISKLHTLSVDHFHIVLPCPHPFVLCPPPQGTIDHLC